MSQQILINIRAEVQEEIKKQAKELFGVEIEDAGQFLREVKATQSKLDAYEREDRNGTLLHLPVPLGAPVFEVYDKCNPGYLDCPYDGGYGTSRCIDRKCKAYYEETEFDLTLLNYLGVTVFLSEIDAQDAVERMNNK